MAPPTFNSKPSLAGDMIVGGSVLCLVSQSGGYAPFEYTWSTGLVESSGVLPLTDAEVGSMITCTVQLTNPDGSATDTTDPWGPIVAAPEPEPEPPTVTWPATPDDVAVLLRARTQDSTDKELGEWTDDTRPTLREVERLLAMAQSTILGQTGPLTPEVLICSTANDIMTQAATTVALLAAMLVELSYFPEQVQSSRSAYEQYRELFWGPDGKSGLVGDLVEAVHECVTGGGVEPDPGGDGGVAVPPPSYAFPVDAGGMVGWKTRW